VPDDDLVSVDDALRAVRRRGISIEEWSQAIADGAVQSWFDGEGHLRVRLIDARTWLPTTTNPDRLHELVRERRRLDGDIDREVQLLLRDGRNWAAIPELLGTTERRARHAHERPPE
jgi:hypothetical protein